MPFDDAFAREPDSIYRDPERLASFERVMNGLRERVEGELGEEDLQHVRRMRKVSRIAELAGRTLIHISLDPVTFSTGVGALWLHKQLEALEIGHAALHGAYDTLPGAEAFQAATFVWETPIDTRSWRRAHNVRHHGHTNVGGKDPDIQLGPTRLNRRVPWRLTHLFQLPLTAATWLNFTLVLNLKYTGLADLLVGSNEPDTWQAVGADSISAWRSALHKASRSALPHYLKNYVLYPALAGVHFPKVLLGNWLAEALRDVYCAASVYSGHVGSDAQDHPVGTRPPSRAAWYVMQVEASHDFEVPLPVSILCGALDKQIEHHLFPTLPPNRLRRIAAEVRTICEAHGVKYSSASWGATLARTLLQLTELSVPRVWA